MKPTLVVMAAGMGSRFGGLKQMTPVDPQGDSILHFSLYDAHRAGFGKVVFIIKKAIRQDFEEKVSRGLEKYFEIAYVEQELDRLPEGFSVPAGRERPWGTAHAVLCCKDVVKEPFSVINADDYYGKTGFQKIAEYLKNDNDDYCMVGFRLANTLTENGSVSRGVCEIQNGCLQSVTERTKIVHCKYTEDNGKTWIRLAPDTIVSMNLWGFRPDIFEYAQRGFIEFLKAHLNEPKAEYYLPSVVSDLISAGKKKVTALIAEDKWYGITYKEDKQSVTAALTHMIEQNLYDGI